MNNTTRDELRDEILGYFEQINSHLDSHDSFTDAEMRSNVNEIIALVTAARDAEIREALLEAADGYIVAKGQDGEAEAAFATRPWMEQILDYIGLGDGREGRNANPEK